MVFYLWFRTTPIILYFYFCLFDKISVIVSQLFLSTVMLLRRAKLYFNSIAPEFISYFKKGYSITSLYKDLYAGLIVAIISFPLAMALAIASGASPDKGLITAIVAGVFTSICGGCRYQIGGPTGAFVIIIFNIIHTYGYDGLIVATIMAGLILIAAGLCKVGRIISYMPYTVTAGFTAGIGITILSTQLNDLFGIKANENVGDFIGRINYLWDNISDVSLYAFLLGVFIAFIIFAMQQKKPQYPRFLIALFIGVLTVLIFDEKFETVGIRFDNLKWTVPTARCPNFSFDMMIKMLPSAITIAFLAGIESLLCAVVADSLTSTKHKSDSELIGQGIANIMSGIFGGLPSTGALARTAANIKAGAVSSLAGVFQACFVGIFMYFLMDYMIFIPISCLAGMLITIAWNMVNFRQCLYIFHSSKGDISVFLITFMLTVLVDITVAVEVGVLMASFVFIKKMAERTELQISDVSREQKSLILEDNGDHEEFMKSNNIQCINIRGPLFFGLAPAINPLLKRISRIPKILILDFVDVPLIDATGSQIIRQFVRESKGIPVILTNLKKHPYEYLKHIDYKNEDIYGHLTKTMKEALKIAEKLLK